MLEATVLEGSVPPHVPSSLVWDDDIARFTMEMDDPYVAGARLHEGPEIVWTTAGYRGEPGGAWLVVGFDAMKEAFTDHERFSSVGSASTQKMLDVSWRQVPIEFDLPEQRHYRKFLAPLLLPAAINRMSNVVEETCSELIDTLAARDSCEFIADFAQLFPSYIFVALMGLPKDEVGQFLTWEREALWSDDLTTRRRGAKAICVYLEAEIDKRRADPQDDLISHIVAAEIDGRPITPDEIIGYCYSLFLGGLDTVMSVMGFSMWHLATNLPLQQRLRENPDLIPKVVDEFLRAHGVVIMRRRVREDCEFRGVTMKAGELVMLATPLAGRDPRHFDDPHLIDPDRRDKTGLTFGSGVHTCVGMHLGRRELRVAFTQLLDRFSEIRLADPEGVQYRTGITWGVDKLPLALVPAQ